MIRGRPPLLVVDGVVAAGVAALICVELSAHWDDGYSAGSARLNVPLLLGVAATLALRRTRPRVATTLAYGLVLLPSLVTSHTVFFFGTLLPLLLLTYTDARLLDRREWLPTLAGPLLLLPVVRLHQPDLDAADFLFWAVLASIAIGMGRLMHRLDGQRLELADALAAQVQGQSARERALLLGERARIARELHDVVAHTVSVMVVQAGAARLAVGTDDEEARQGMLAVEQTGRQALVDLRRLLGLLRPDDDEMSAPAPAPGLDAVPELVERMRSAGLTVSVTHQGANVALSPGLDLSAYRIVQESLTNVLKHCGPTHVSVDLTYGDDLEIRVRNDAPRRTPAAPPPPRGGHGLVGLRERTAMFDGDLEAGPDGRGWQVRARLPMATDDTAVERV